MNKQALSLTFALCLGFTLLTACGPGPGDPMSALPNQAALHPNSGSQTLMLQSPLASFQPINDSLNGSSNPRSGSDKTLHSEQFGR